MKNILVSTDFSVAAENAAHYAIGLAKKLKMNITLCNAYKVPSDAPMAVQIAWPLIDEADLENESEGSLVNLVDQLSKKDYKAVDNYCPQISFESKKGEVCQILKELVKRKKIDLVIMGMAGAGQLIQWALGSNSKIMIDEAEFPVLYVPYVAKFRVIRKIAFATNLSTDDLEPLQFICRMAKSMDSEIIVYHITSSEVKKTENDRGLEEAFFDHVVSKLDYGKIKFENIWHSDIHEGFRWIRDNKEIDMIAIVHRQHNIVDKLINGSYTHKLSRFTKVPLLVFQPCEKIY